MKVSEIAERLALTPVSQADTTREASGVYIGDLLSWVMGKAESGNAWITIMNNINVLAVASLTDVSCVILAEGVTIEGDILETARAKEINVLRAEAPIYQVALTLSDVLR